MDMETDCDDPMEIDDNLPATPIIERRSIEITTTPANPSQPPEQSSEVTSSSQISKSVSVNTDIVVLDDDDDSPADSKALSSRNAASVKEIIDLVEKPHGNTRCLNSLCSGENSECISAPDFCLSYYRVKRSKSYKEEICKDCYTKAVDDFEILAMKLKNKELILKSDYPVINETLQIEDSDDEEDLIDEEAVYFDKENFDFIEKNIQDILEQTLKDVDLHMHFEKEKEYFQKDTTKFKVDVEEIEKCVKEVRTQLDRIQLNLYNEFRPDFRTMRGLTIIDDYTQSQNTIVKAEPTIPESPRKSNRSHKPVSYVELDELGNSNSPKVATSNKPAEMEPPTDLPPILPAEKPAPQVGEMYYIARENAPESSWIRARLQNVIVPESLYNAQGVNVTTYKLIELKQQKDRVLTGKHMAYFNASKVRLPVGTRVISVLKETSNTGGVKKPRLDPYYAGIVAEQPFEGNKYRYLIFFDIGYAQYVSYHSVNIVLDSSPNVWEDILEESRPFIKKYLESQDRPMVKLAKDQTVRVEYNGKWWLCTVTNVDCSLVQVFFDVLSRTEWIYRGSTRLSPMYREERAATNRHSGMRNLSRKLGPNESATVVQYTRNNDFVLTNTNQPEQPTSTTSVRAVARKSTTKPQNSTTTPNIVPFLPPVNNTPANTQGPMSKIMYFTPRDQVIIKRHYKAHICSSKCKEYLTHNFAQLRGHNPLSKPLLCGWARMTSKAKSGNKKEIMYKAPCGRLLRNIADVHFYLRETESEMTVDLFDFNHMVRCLAEFSVECPPDPKDLSKGLEQVPIPVINGINNEMLDFCNYSIKRVPMEGVSINTDPEFLCGCDCEDNCIDKSKCACWKLTLEGAKYLVKDVDPLSVGYIYRRLPEQVVTGIYECNSRCKCNSTCLNRVAQNPMSLKLQVFKTHNRGWGIRCLNDVPQGTFICIYAGTLHTEAMANMDGKAYGDEYFAELDYIETVEKVKEDYEAEVMEDMEEEEVTKKRKDEEEEEEDEEDLMMNSRKNRNSYNVDNDFTPHHPVYKEGDSTIRTRLRRRVEDKPEVKFNSKIGLKLKTELPEPKSMSVDTITDDVETVTISDEEDEGREVLNFDSKAKGLDEKNPTYSSVRELFNDDDNVYVMDAKNAGNIGRFLNHSCSPNVFVQNVFVDTHDLRFPWVSFFSSQFIRAGTELTWNYNYDIGSVPDRVLYCLCASLECKGRLL